MPVNRDFRVKLGYTNAEELKKYFKANDIVEINWESIKQYNKRIKNIFTMLNNVVYEGIRPENMTSFNDKIDNAYLLLKGNNIIPRLNNNGRPPESVYYNWMRGYAVCEYFSKALSIIFGVPQGSIKAVGNDKLTDIRTFAKSPTADLEIELDGKTVRLEIQSGFTGVNDIKKHKVNEAKRVFAAMGICSYIVHFDLYNGNAAIVDISSIDDNDMRWEHRKQFEDQVVFSIPKEAFKWAITDKPLNYKGIVC